jgi:hypothetical protein
MGRLDGSLEAGLTRGWLKRIEHAAACAAGEMAMAVHARRLYYGYPHLVPRRGGTSDAVHPSNGEVS